MKEEWRISESQTEAVSELENFFSCSPVTAKILVNRGISSTQQASAFFNPTFKSLNSPFQLKDMKKAVTRIADAIQKKEKILIFGDYDVDGITATTLLYTFFNRIGAETSFYIPHRLNEGYSFHEHHVESVLIPEKADLVITVDCGIDCHEAVKKAGDNFIDVIITDHHSVPDILPHAFAILNPKQQDCNSGLDDLAGVGVAFYLLIALRKHLRDLGFWRDRDEPNLKDFCDLVALGTIGDIVPLKGVNRVITKAGIDVINTSPRPGIRAIINASKVNKDLIDSTDIAFKIAPRINAAGRIDHAGIVVNLLSKKNQKDVLQTAKTLNRFNTIRQEMEKATLDEIEEHIEATPSVLEKKAIILFKKGWHIGILGIVASRLVNRYHLPVILIAVDGTTGKGSGRSIPGVNLFSLLRKCSDTLEGYGGHSMAAGLKIPTARIEEFTQKFHRHAAAEINDTCFKKQTEIDCRIDFSDISPVLLNELEQLHPFGAGNPEPLFITDDIIVKSSSIVAGRHRRLVLIPESGNYDTPVMAMHFNVSNDEPYPDHFSHIVFTLQWNRWNNSKSIQMIIEDYL